MIIKDKVRCIDIELAIFRLYDVRQHIIVPNVSNMMGLVPFETDMLVLTKSGYATGFEIKVSKGDLLADLKKEQYKIFEDKENKIQLQEFFYAKRFKYFYYAVAKELEETAIKIIPSFAGLYVYEKKDYPMKSTFNCVKKAKQLKTYNWSENDVRQLMRLGCLRIYNLKQKLATKSLCS